MDIIQQPHRTVTHGKLTIVAFREPCVVQVGADMHTPELVRKLARETPPGPGAAELIRVLNEQADWAEGKDL